jgi:hypothetical protein
LQLLPLDLHGVRDVHQLHFHAFIVTCSAAVRRSARVMVVRKPPLRAVPGSSDDTEPSDDDVISKRTRTDTEPSSTKSGFDASQGVVVCRGSKDLAIAETKRLLSAVHVGGTFRIENSKTDPYPYFYMVCKVCRDAKCGMWVKPGAGSTWTIKSVTTALGTACAGGQISSRTSAVAPQVEQHRAGA